MTSPNGPAPVLVTGATGRVGRALVDELRTRGVPVRALVRAPVVGALPAGVDARRGDLGDPGTVREAADGARAAFLLWPTGSVDDDRTAAVVAALARTGHVVHLSARGVADGPSDDELGPILASHRRVERLLRGSGARWTSVRGGGFASNTLAWAADVRSSSVVRAPYGGIPRPYVHERDLAAVAALALTGDARSRLDGATPEVTGPRTVSGREQVDALAAALGRPLRLEALDWDAARQDLLDTGVDPVTADSMLDTWWAMVAEPERPTDTVPRLLGRPALSYEQWARDHAEDFR